MREQDLRRRDPSQQGTESVKTRSCWHLLNYLHSFERVIQKPLRKDHRQHLTGKFLCAPDAKFVPQVPADLVVLLQSCLKGDRSRQSKGAVPSGTLLIKCFGGGIWLSDSLHGPLLLSCGSLQLSSPQQRN